MVGILKCCGEAEKASATATYQTILKMRTHLLKVWNQNFLTAFGTTPTMYYISYYLLKRTLPIICDNDLIPLPLLQKTTI